jgi:hypothetical protein
MPRWFNTPEYRRLYPHLYPLYRAMLSRCLRPNDRSYDLYGGAGITVCDEWINDKEAFSIWAINNGYRFGLSLDRIDNCLGYSPSNCRWITPHEQLQNQKRNKITPDLVEKIRAETVYKNQYELAKKYNVNQSTISRIMNKKRWSNI